MAVRYYVKHGGANVKLSLACVQAKLNYEAVRSRINMPTVTPQMAFDAAIRQRDAELELAITCLRTEIRLLALECHGARTHNSAKLPVRPYQWR